MICYELSLSHLQVEIVLQEHCRFETTEPVFYLNEGTLLYVIPVNHRLCLKLRFRCLNTTQLIKAFKVLNVC